MPKKVSKIQAVKHCRKFCKKFIEPDQCPTLEMVKGNGEINPESKHFCYLCGWINWREEHGQFTSAFGKVYPAPPCE